MSDPRPIPLDPSAEMVSSMLEIDQSWLLGTDGEYEAFAVEAMKGDGSNWQRVVAVRWPARINKTDEQVMLRLLISPQDAIGLAAVMIHTANWLAALGEIEGP